MVSIEDENGEILLPPNFPFSRHSGQLFNSNSHFGIDYGMENFRVKVCHNTMQYNIIALFQYFQGDLPVIISVPHGGLVDVSSIPYRLSGCPVQGTSPDDPKEQRCDYEAPHHDRSCIDSYNCPATTVTDDFTIDLALTVANRLEDVTGRRPHVVQCNMIRTKVDVNRGVGEAAQGNRIATQVFNDYHNYIHEAKKTFGRGLVLDLHGQVRYAFIHSYDVEEKSYFSEQRTKQH